MSLGLHFIEYLLKGLGPAFTNMRKDQLPEAGCPASHAIVDIGARIADSVQ